MKKVLVTGADGFIGSHLVEGLLKEDNSIRAFNGFVRNFVQAKYISSYSSIKWLQS